MFRYSQIHTYSIRIGRGPNSRDCYFSGNTYPVEKVKVCIADSKFHSTKVPFIDAQGACKLESEEHFELFKYVSVFMLLMFSVIVVVRIDTIFTS